MAARTVLNRLEMASGLDRIGAPLRRAVEAVVRGRLRDVLRGVWLGHPLHPVAVQLPMGAWMSAAVLDALPGTRAASTVLIGVGTASAAPAALAGLNDWAALSPEQRRVGLVHASTNTVGLALFAGSLAARLSGNQRLGRGLVFAGLASVGLGGYLGGHLTYRMAAGVNQAEPFLRQIPEGWHDICDYAALIENKPTTARIGDVPLLASRTRDGVTVMLGHCGHETGPLGDGDVTEIDGAACITCPWHGSTFRLADAKVVRGPAATDQPQLRTRIVNGRVEAALP
jgi:nitrite reductase/ring-hydroxylating ferredoxin subunit/uncharacterized membrane protein